MRILLFPSNLNLKTGFSGTKLNVFANTYYGLSVFQVWLGPVFTVRNTLMIFNLIFWK